MIDYYRLKIFRAILDRKSEQILNPADASTYRHVNRLYNLSFWACLASIPANFYFGGQIAKIPTKAPTFMLRSILYTTFSTVLFLGTLYRYQGCTKDMSTRYLTNLSTPELEQYLNSLKGVYVPPQANPYTPQPPVGMLQHYPGPQQLFVQAMPTPQQSSPNAVRTPPDQVVHKSSNPYI